LVQHLDAIDMQARDDLQAAEMRARQRGGRRRGESGTRKTSWRRG
jgi:hypothetical protein